jgi:hypothetical protein
LRSFLGKAQAPRNERASHRVPANNFTIAALVAMPVARSRSLPVSATNGFGVGAVRGSHFVSLTAGPSPRGSIRSKTLREVCSIVDDGPAVLNIQEQQPRKPGNPAAMWRQAG